MELPPTSLIHTVSKTDTTTTTQNMQQGSKKHMSTRVTQCIQPIFKSTAIQNTHPTLKTAATQYTLPTSRNHSSTCTYSQHLTLNSSTSTSTSTSTDVSYQPNTHHILKHTCTSAPSANHHSPKRS